MTPSGVFFYGIQNTCLYYTIKLSSCQPPLFYLFLFLRDSGNRDSGHFRVRTRAYHYH